MPLRPETDFAKVLSRDEQSAVLASRRQYDYRQVIAADECEPDFLADLVRMQGNVLLNQAAEAGEALDWSTARFRLAHDMFEGELSPVGARLAVLTVDVLP